MKKAIVLCSLLCWLGGSAWAQRTISGVIYDDLGNPLEEATIYVTGSKIGAISDEKGRYTVKVPDEEVVIKFAYDSGWSSPEIKVEKDENTLNVVFVPYMPFRYHKAPLDKTQLSELIQVRGKVLDENRRPAAGVSVRLEGTNRSAATGSDGYFELEIPPGPNVIRFQDQKGSPEVKVTVVESCHIDVFLLPSATIERWERKLNKIKKQEKRNERR
jgi:hypothetical protein